jgi:GH15 family glucan-1,4-alpha-glucosidase
VAGVPAQAQIMYSITGENRLTEWEVDWLPGYEGAKPVRIGNGAHDQIQIDVYGEMMDALYQAHRGGVASSADAGLCNRLSSPISQRSGESPIAAFGRVAARLATLR